MDLADALFADSGYKDIASGHMRARSWIRLNRLDDARGMLEQLEAWKGTACQHAKALFLRGWIHLQHNEAGKARQVYRRIIDDYPCTPYAEKAEDMLGRLGGR